MNNKTTSIMILFVAIIGVGSSVFDSYANAQNETNTDPNVLKGSITSIQDDNPDDNTEWIVGGL
jgi:hypothetical protein